MVEQLGLDLDLHLLDFRHVVAFASEAKGVILLIIIGIAIGCVFFVGIRIIRGQFFFQIIHEELFKIIIKWLVVELK